MEEKITVSNLYKVFGPSPGEAVKLINQGKGKNEIFELTGMTVGVQDASFGVQAGEIFVVMGLSGSGKSTLVRMLNRLIKPTSGEILVEGNNVTQLNQKQLVEFRRKYMSMVFQSFALMPHLTVLDNVSFGLDLAGMPKSKQHERALKALEQVGLGGLENSKPNELSGGMQQRVGLARGLAVDPDILLMDEAFSALDPLIRTEMQDELLKLQERHKRTIVFISHDLDEALRIGDRIAIMDGGVIVQVGTPEEILQNPSNEYVRAFFRGVDPTNVISAGDIVKDTQPTFIWTKKEGSPRTILERLSSLDRDYAYILDAEHRFHGIVSSDSLKELLESSSEDKNIKNAFLDDVNPVRITDSMQDILPEVASRSCPIPVIDEDGIYKGVVSKNRFLHTLHRAEEKAN